jgi:hypothetical protein
MTTEGAAIYSEFVELLSCFDKAVMLDLVEDALKDAHDASLLSAYAGSGPGPAAGVAAEVQLGN